MSDDNDTLTVSPYKKGSIFVTRLIYVWLQGVFGLLGWIVWAVSFIVDPKSTMSDSDFPLVLIWCISMVFGAFVVHIATKKEKF